MVNNYSQSLVVFQVVSESSSLGRGNKIVLLDPISDAGIKPRSPALQAEALLSEPQTLEG